MSNIADCALNNYFDIKLDVCLCISIRSILL